MAQVQRSYRDTEQLMKWRHRSRRVDAITSTVKVAIVGASAFGVTHELAPFAGKKTSLVLQIGVYVGLNGVAAVMAAFYKFRDQRKELKRLRAEVTELEAANDELRHLKPAATGELPA